MNARFVSVLFFFICAMPCFAQANTEIRSDAVDVRDHSDHMFFSFAGNVTVISDKFQLSSDRLDVISSKEDDFLQTGDCGNSIKEVHAFGNVKFTQNCRSGMADEVIVDPASGTVTLLGNATIVNPDGTAHGDKLFLNRDSNLVKVESAGRSVVSINDFKKNQMPDKKLEPCNGCPNFAECEPDE